MSRAILSRSAWLASERGAHTRAMGGVQAFPLFGDGANTREACTCDTINGGDSDATAGAVADARYLDWLAQQRGEGATRGQHIPPAELTLTAEPVAKRRATPRTLPMQDPVLSVALGLLQSLSDEFGDIFPDEYASARAFLARHNHP